MQKAVQPRLEWEPGLPVERLRMTRLILALSRLAAPAALAQKVTVEFDQAADFSKYKSFAIRKGQLNSRNPALNGELVKKQIETDIADDLGARGLTEVSDHPDLNVVYQFGSARRNEIETYPAGWRGWGTRVVRMPYAEGTLVIDLRDTSAHSLDWRGISSAEKSDATKIEGKLDSMVKKGAGEISPQEIVPRAWTLGWILRPAFHPAALAALADLYSPAPTITIGMVGVEEPASGSTVMAKALASVPAGSGGLTTVALP